MNTKKALTMVAIAFIVFFILSSPNDAGSLVHSAFGGIQTAANQLAAFLKALAG